MFNFKDHYNKLEELIGNCYQSYKDNFNDQERADIEEYLYKQGEYELAFDEFIAVLEWHKIVMDEKYVRKLDEAKRLMRTKPTTIS